MSKELYSSIQMVSRYHAYSQLFGIVMDTILNKFPKDFFPTIAITESHPLNEYRDFSFKEILKKSKPALLASPRFDFDYDGDPFADNPFGLDMMHLPDGEGEPIVRDYTNDIFLSVSRFIEIKIDVPIRIRVESRSQQMEFNNYINNAFRIGHNIIFNKDVEYPVSNDLIVQIGRDLKMPLVEDVHGVSHIKDNVQMLSYLNSHSFLKFVCTYNTHVGYYTYGFIFKDVQIKLDMTDRTNPDDGEKKGQYYDNYNIDIMIKAYMNVPHSYLYHSEFVQLVPQFESISDLYIKSILNYKITLYNIQIPKINDKGWNISTSNQYIEEDLHKYIVDIPVRDILGSIDDVITLLQYKKSFPPEMYIDIKFYNGNKYLPILINWETDMMQVLELTTITMSEIFVYINSKYVHDSIDILNTNKKIE